MAHTTTGDHPAGTSPQQRWSKPQIVPTVRQSPFSASEHRRWRAEFPILKRQIYLANCSQGAQARQVRAAVTRYLDSWATAGLDWDCWLEELDRAKAEFARLINADPGDVAVVASVSDAIARLAGSLDYTGPRRRILLTEAEFPTVGQIWLAHRKHGAEVDFVPLTDGEVRLADYARLVDEGTLLVGVTHVYYQTGYKQDLRALADLVHSRGSYLLVDAYQSAGTCPLDVQALDIDILTTGNLKYLLGVPGIAFIYVQPEVAAALQPTAAGWFGQADPFAFLLKKVAYAPSARRLEGGTPPVMAAFAARAGMELIRQVGVERIAQHIDYLSAYCLQGALDRGLKVVSPLDVRKKGAITAIQVPGDAHAVERALRERGVVTAARGPVIRIAPHFFNTTAELEAALDALAAVLETGSP